MHQDVMDQVSSYIGQQQVPLVGAASAEALNTLAPAGYRPQDLLPEAKTVLILARPLPAAVFTAARHNKTYVAYTGAFHAYYAAMTQTVSAISVMLESAGYAALPIPTYSPLVFHNGEPRGVASLKHFAVQAGLGKLGKNTLLIHPTYGNTLRLGGLLTTMEWPADQPADLPQVCPEKCDICIRSCPAGALSKDGIDITRCMANCIEHILLPPLLVLRLLRWLAARSRLAQTVMEQYTLSFFEMYGVSCFQCLLNCPHFAGRKRPASR